LIVGGELGSQKRRNIRFSEGGGIVRAKRTLTKKKRVWAWKVLTGFGTADRLKPVAVETREMTHFFFFCPHVIWTWGFPVGAAKRTGSSFFFK
jgi:hypothetical protein